MQKQMSLTCSTAGSDRDQPLKTGEKKWIWDGERQVFCNWTGFEGGLQRVEAEKLVGEKGYLQSLPKSFHIATGTQREGTVFVDQVSVMLFATANMLVQDLFIY